MSATNPLLSALSEINEIRAFSDSLAGGLGASLEITASVCRAYFIGALSLSNKLVVVSDNAFVLYHESLGVPSLSCHYHPTALGVDIVPSVFDHSTPKRLQSLANQNPDVIFTEGGLNTHVPRSMMFKSLESFSVRVKEKLLIRDALKTINEYGYIENNQTKYNGEYSHRGCIIDVFPNNTKNPCRIEFDGNVVTSIRFYNPTSQMSIETTNILLIPNIKLDVSDELSITYKDYYASLGYGVLGEQLINDTCFLKYDGVNNDREPLSLLIQHLNIKNESEIGKYIKKYSSLYIVGTSGDAKHTFPKRSIYIDGYINNNFLIEHHGIAVIGVGYKKANETTIQKEEIEGLYTYNWGDHITHVDYGIGLYRGIIKKRDIEYIKLEYANNATVLLSAGHIDMITPLIGHDNPILNDIGNRAWANKKQKTRKSIQSVIEDMVAVNRNKQSRRENHYKNEDYLEKTLSDSFPYIETKDQATAIVDIYKDMTSPGLMDRIIIGDVGFGKTEVALRAAAKAAFSGVFVMLIVPTTILANQHYILFKNRLENFGINVAMLSRFITKQKQKIIINNIEDKHVDILIGTHKLLSNEVPKNNLGLLIIDDEHRFGVVHKNKILKIKQSVDVLTLTATPIPRTLQQSLLGLKSVSLINTPPVKRVPIKTQVIYQNWEYIKKVMEVEINRGGQVYFLHNRVGSIPFYKKKIIEMFPKANVASAHGGMGGRQLEKIILSFFDGNIQVLVSTTIIESGLDVPNANTIIITAPHLYGISQLYQIRGRVGRGDRQGFCYLIIPKDRGLSDGAIERLKTIQENTSLGSGYRIAIKDLELRGAGNVFGYEQSGHISNIGYHLYCKMFNEEINKSRGLANNFRVPKIKYYESASLDDAYVPNPQDRLYYYQRLSTAKDIQELNDVKEEITDRYGKPDNGTTNLYKITEMRIAYTNTLVKSIQIKKKRAVLTLIDAKPETPTELSISKLMNALEKSGIKYMFKRANKDTLGLELICDESDEPVTALIQNVELFYYENNNT